MGRRPLNIRAKKQLPKSNFVLNVTNRDKAKWFDSVVNNRLTDGTNTLTDGVNTLVFT